MCNQHMLNCLHLQTLCHHWLRPGLNMASTPEPSPAWFSGTAMLSAQLHILTKNVNSSVHVEPVLNAEVLMLRFNVKHAGVVVHMCLW